MSEQALCELCGEPMPPGEEMFKFHGYSGNCPKPPLPHRKFRKKPVVIEAMQFDGTNAHQCQVFIGTGYSMGSTSESFAIQTLEGLMTVSKGDWIIKGVKGEFYPCKPDIFAATYEVAYQ